MIYDNVTIHLFDGANESERQEVTGTIGAKGILTLVQGSHHARIFYREAQERVLPGAQLVVVERFLSDTYKRAEATAARRNLWRKARPLVIGKPAYDFDEDDNVPELHT